MNYRHYCANCGHMAPGQPHGLHCRVVPVVFFMVISVGLFALLAGTAASVAGMCGCG